MLAAQSHDACCTDTACTLLCLLRACAALSEAVALYREAQAMLPQPNQPFTQLDTLTATLTPAGGSAAKLVGVEVFGSSSVMDDMAHAAVWLAVATGAGVARRWSTPSNAVFAYTASSAAKLCRLWKAGCTTWACSPGTLAQFVARTLNVRHSWHGDGSCHDCEPPEFLLANYWCKLVHPASTAMLAPAAGNQSL